MAPLAFLFTFLALFFSCIGAAPSIASRDLAGDIANLLNLGLVTHIDVFIGLDTLTTNLVSVNFDVKNPLPLEFTIDRVVSSAGLNGTVYATFDQSFPISGSDESFIVPPLGSTSSGTFPNVNLTQGAIASLDIIPAGELDLMDVDVYLRALTINGDLGIPIPVTGLKQKGVNTAYTINLG